MNTSVQKEPQGSAGVYAGVGTTPHTVLVPMLNLGIAGDMLNLAAILASGHRLFSAIPLKPPKSGLPEAAQSAPRIVVLGVVEVPEGQPLATGLDMARSYRTLFEFLPGEVEVGRRHVQVDRLVKVARNVPAAVRAAVAEEHADIVLAHWRGQPSQSKRHVYGHILDALIKNPPCHLILARPEGWRDACRVLLPVRGGPSARQALDLALSLSEHNDLPVTVLHNVPTPRTGTGPLGEGRRLSGPLREAGIREAIETGPYIEFNEHLETAARHSPARIERIATVNDDATAAVLGEVKPDDLLIMGMSAPPDKRGKGGDASSSLPLKVAAATSAALLLVRTCETLDLARYTEQAARAQQRKGWVDMPFEYWFVENTYHADEFRDPDEFLKLKQAAGLKISVALLTSNDSKHARSIITGLKRVLLEMHPIADQLCVVDAGSIDGTLDIVRSLGVDAYTATEILADEGSLHGRGESWWKSLGVLQGDIVVWLDPRAVRFHPSLVLSLAGPLLRRPSVQLVKAFAQAQGQSHPAEGAEQDSKPNAPNAAQQHNFVPTDISWGGFVVPKRDGTWPFARSLRVQALKPGDLLALSPAQFAALPPRTILQALFPALAGVVDPFGKDFAARRDAMLSIPIFTGHNLDVGVLLSVAEHWGAGAIAQVELRSAIPATPPQPSLRNAIDTLQVLSLRLQDEALRKTAADTAERLQKDLEGPTPAPDDKFVVRALKPVERKPLGEVLRKG